MNLKEFKKEFYLYPYMSLYFWNYKSIKKIHKHCQNIENFECFKNIYDSKKNIYEKKVNNFNKLQEITGKKLPINWASELSEFSNISSNGGGNKFIGKSSNAKTIKDMLKSDYFDIQKYDAITDTLTIKLKNFYYEKIRN